MEVGLFLLLAACVKLQFQDHFVLTRMTVPSAW